MTAVIFTLKSRNAKTGPIPVSTSQGYTCPSACPLKRNGCYAEHGPLGMLWSSMRNSMAWSDFTQAVSALPNGQLWRHNQAGDLPHVNQHIDRDSLNLLVDANSGKRGFTYTHHDPEIGYNSLAITEANRAGFTINLSANNLEHADKLKSLEIGPVVTVLPIDTAKTVSTPAGNRVVVCPATYRDNVNCASCKLCSIADRDVIVGFPAHGAAKRKASEVAA